LTKRRKQSNAMNNENTEPRVVILAARSTIAQAVVRQLAREGAQVALIARDLDGIDVNGASYTATCDLTDFDEVERTVGEARDALGGITGVVNCAGSMILKPAHLTSPNEFHDVIAANLTTAFAAVRAAAKHLDNAGGSIVLISSAAGSLGMPNHDLIGAAKAGVEGLVRCAAATYASRGIRVNAVAPGLTTTRMTEKLLSANGTRKISESLHPLGRIGNPEDIASAVCWLLDPAQQWLTGQVIGVDGGLSRVQPKPRMGVPAQ
jgi:NAD(P)-dependent dehydrogenase (short-subunit alcohol dehydrogenase family)